MLAAKNFSDPWHLDCQEPTADFKGNHGKEYSFESIRDCKLLGFSGSIENMGPDFMHWLEVDPSFDIRKKVEVIRTDGASNFDLELIEYRDSGHGMMKIYYDSKVISEKRSFFLKSDSRSIKASGDAKYTISEIFELSLEEKASNTLNFKVKKFVKIKKPTIAPASLFKSEVKKGMRKDIKLTATRYIKQLSLIL